MDGIIATRTTPQLLADLAELDAHRNRVGYLPLEERIVGGRSPTSSPIATTWSAP